MVAISKLVNNTNDDGVGKNKITAAIAGATNNNQLQASAVPTTSTTTKTMAVAGNSAVVGDLLKNSSSKASSTPTAAATVALTANGKPKEKRRNNEKRKERSRDAARCRRSRETEIFTELAQVLPLKKEDVQQLDKASVMRIAIAYLKVRDMLKMFPKIQALCGDLNIPYNPEEDENHTQDTHHHEEEEDHNSLDNSRDSESESQHSHSPTEAEENDNSDKKSSEEDGKEDNSIESTRLLKQTLDGFLLILSNDGDITYVTDNICDYLGISKIDMLGQQIWEYAHQCDHAELKEALNIKRNGLSDKIKDEHMQEEGISTDHRDLFVRLKCTLTSRGRSINIKSASYKVIHITGHLVVNNKGDRVLVAMGRPIPHPSNIEIPLGSTTFLTKHSLDMKFVYVDDKMFDLLGYKPEDLLETSLFDRHHGIDSDSLMMTFKNVLSKGQGETCRYRFLGKYGGYCWLVTQATIVYDKLKPQSVVCVNYVISNLEKENEIYTLQQYEESQKLKRQEIKENNLGDNSSSNCSSNKYNNNEVLNSLQEIKNSKLEEPEEEHHHKIEPQQENPLNDQNKNEINNNNNTNENKPQQILNPIQIKREQTPPVVVVSQPNNTTTTTPINPTITATASVAVVNPQKPPITTICNNNNNRNNNSITDNSGYSQQQPLLVVPIPPQLPHTYCPTTTVTSTIFGNKSNTATGLSAIPPTPPPPPATTVTRTIFENKSSKFIDDKTAGGPKTVTSLILRPAIPYGANLPTTTSTQSILQLQQQSQHTITASVFAPKAQTTTTAAILAKQQQQQQQPTTQQPAAAPATTGNQQDMNRGYLTFAEDATELAMLKEEPDDLTAHLVAPNAVDACLPLDENFNEMLVGLMGSYGGLLADDINSLDSTSSSSSNTGGGDHHNQHHQQPHQQHSSHNSNNSGSLPEKLCNLHGANNASSPYTSTATSHHNNHHQRHSPSSSSSSSITPSGGSMTNNGSGGAPNSTNSSSSNSNNSGGSNSSSNCTNSAVTNNTTNSTNIDPFIINNRDESNDTLCSQHLLSPPSASSKSPDGSSLPSLCSPNSLSQEDDFYFTMNVDDMDDLTMRAPYIPMNEQDDLPLLTSDDLMWSSGNAYVSILNSKETDNLQTLQSLNQTINNYQQQPQFTQHQHQQQYSNSLCSSPASTVSSMSPSSPLQQHGSQQFLASDSSELAALLCSSASGSLSLLHDTNGLSLNGEGNNGNSNSNANNTNDNCVSIVGSGCGSTDSGSAMLTDDLDSVSVASTSSSSINLNHHQQLQQQQQQFQQQCLQHLQDQLQQHQQQQQQQLLSELNISCKKERFDTTNSTPVSLTPSLCDSIEDSFDSVYNKNSTNLDCWSDFLQINPAAAAENSNNGAAAATLSPSSAAQTGGSATISTSSSPALLDTIRQNEDCKQQLHMQLQQQQQQQNIIINAVPLITIQSNNKNLLIQTPQQQQQQAPPTSSSSSPSPSSSTIQNNGKIMNKVNTIKLTPITSTATIRIIENRQPLMGQQQPQNVVKTAFIHTGNGNLASLQQHNATAAATGNKRHLSSTQFANAVLDSKRMKGTAINNESATSQLLQQLITTTTCNKAQTMPVIKDPKTLMANSSSNARWSNSCSPSSQEANGLGNKQRQHQQQQQQSNSVLKNLLISGCDKPCMIKTELLNNEDAALDRCYSPSLTRPLRCVTSITTPSPSPNMGLLSYLNNPLICGPGELPSPTLAAMAVMNEDSNPPGLTSCHDVLDTASDSGIDDSLTENMSPLKRCYEHQPQQQHQQQQGAQIKDNGGFGLVKAAILNNEKLYAGKQEIKMRSSIIDEGLIMIASSAAASPITVADEDGASNSKRKRSISFLDSSNPLMTTPFLMDLCNDDYNMNKEFLEENDIDNVLNVWPTELA
uniref:Uncharacterized protein n=1 Tax=Stomoxys calcitrans TaxID=35570 RepID=A0A1I8P5B3_STOCA